MTSYLDNAATSFPKPESVYVAQDRVARTCGANPGRGGHRLAYQAAQVVLMARMAVATFFNIANSAQIAFTSNATEAINMALFGLLQPGDRVVTSSMEHNAVARPLYALEQRGVEVVKINGDADGRITLDDVKSACRQRPRMVVLNHCSNVTGIVQPIETIGPWCREQGIVFMVDAAQSAGILAIDVETMAIDLLAVPGHKSLFGPQGTGLLYVNESLSLSPLKYGGTGTSSSHLEQPRQMPEHLECGTLNTPGLAALTAGLDFVRQEGMAQIHRHEQNLAQQLRQGLLTMGRVHCYGQSQAECGVLSFTVEGMDSAEVGFLLDQRYQIAVRVGLHCAPDAHRTIGSFPHGTIRVSPGYFNTPHEIDCLLAAMQEIVSGLH